MNDTYTIEFFNRNDKWELVERGTYYGEYSDATIAFGKEIARDPHLRHRIVRVRSTVVAEAGGEA